MSRVLQRFFNTLAAKSGSGLFIRTRPDRNTPEQNRSQIAGILNKQNILGDFNVVIALAQTVFIRPENNNRLYVAGSPHIAVAAFDRNMQIIDGCFMSKGLLAPKATSSPEYQRDIIVGQQYVTEARYQDSVNTLKHYFANPSATSSYTSDYSNGKDSSKIHNAGGDFYLIVLPQITSLNLLIKSIKSYKATNSYYDRMANNCGHAVLRSLGYTHVLPTGLSTQGALEVALTHFNILSPKEMPELLKSPFELGDTESEYLRNRHLVLKHKESYTKHLRYYFGIEI